MDSRGTPEQVGIHVKLDQSGLTVEAKSRAVAALDRLVGSFADWANVRLEGSIRAHQVRQANHEALLKAEGEAALSLAQADPAFGTRLKNRFVEEETRKQLNREAVAAEFLEVNSSLPPPSAGDAKPDPLDDDWLNVFSGYVENATSDRMRKLWARILAGEVRKTGSFSIRTLRILSELEQKAAVTFQEMVKSRFPAGYIIKPEQHQDEALLNSVMLEEAGLIQESNGSLQLTLRPDEEGYIVFSVQGRGHVVVGDLILRLKPKDRRTIQVPIIKITGVGAELATLLPATPTIDLYGELVSRIEQDLEEALVFRCSADLGGGEVSLALVRSLKTSVGEMGTGGDA